MSHEMLEQKLVNRRKRRRELYAAKKKQGSTIISINAVVASAASVSTSYTNREVPNVAYTLPTPTYCRHCRAKKFHKECRTFCCSDGKVKLADNDMPTDLRVLYISKSSLCADFRKICRTYNNQFAFTSFGVKYDKNLCKMNKGIYIFRIQGQVYHYMNSLSPEHGIPSYLQLYFYDTCTEIENRLRNCDRFDREIVEKLIGILALNPYAQFFRSLRNYVPLTSVNIKLHCDSSLDQRVYNRPTASQVAAIWVDSDSSRPATRRSINVVGLSGDNYRVQHYYGCYDPLQYPLLFAFGEPGWHEGIEKITNPLHERSVRPAGFGLSQLLSPGEVIHQEEKVHSCSHARFQVSVREYYCYKLQIRLPDTSFLLHTGRLFQQYVVDMYVKTESSRLDFIRHNQKQIRSELYQGIVDSVESGENRGYKIGKRIVLPASFTGGPRDNAKRYMDAMALVQRFGRPDIFITMTCNPNWNEIRAELMYEDEAQNRPDLVVRIFKSKLEELKKDLLKRKILGPVAASIYVVEFQKRGLPHVHCLLILKQSAKIRSPEQVDEIVSCEIPGENINPYLRSRVVKHMMHGPCGTLNPKNVCMQNEINCKNKYPKDFVDATSLGNDSYAVYRRPNCNERVKVRGQYLDNRWVVPYNPYLLAKFDCHINVEICSSVKAVKYFYKYLYKGCDRIRFSVNEMDKCADIDEISNYQNARWLSAPEAAWRIYEFPLAQNLPAVIPLQLHLPDCQPMIFKDTDDLQKLAKNEFQRRTMLTEYFRMNRINDGARNILYRDFPVCFVWDTREKRWLPRQRKDVIGRIVSANPNEGERYYERMLLNHVKGATSFENLKNVNSKQCNTFGEAVSEYGLLNDDKNSELCLDEAVIYSLPSSLRRLFATILVFCSPTNPGLLWLKYKEFMIEDFIRNKLSFVAAETQALQSINHILEVSGKNINNYNILTHEVCDTEVDKFTAMLYDENRFTIEPQNLDTIIDELNKEQKFAYNHILNAVLEDAGGQYFIDGPGGTGKTFLYNALLCSVRAKNIVALATTSSGVAAFLLPNGRTAHSQFKLPLDVTSSSNSSITKQSALGMLLSITKLIIWDEAPMMHRGNIEALDRLLRDIAENNIPFGGKVVVLGGDFRQLLPVVPNGMKSDIIYSSIAYSHLWSSFTHLSLVQNMRTNLDHQFANFLLSICDGIAATECCDMIELPSNIMIPYEDETTSLNNLIDIVFPNITLSNTCLKSVINRVILTPKNIDVDIINKLLLKKFKGDTVTYYSYDEVIEKNELAIHEDFLNTLTPNGIPPHELVLKKDCPVILLRNINPSEGLCNGTRLICKNFQKNVIDAEIATGTYIGKRVFLPKIPFIPLETDRRSVPFRRTQFPVRPCFAITINKAQGHTLDFVGLYLPDPIFSHGQLYVALSRARSSSDICVLIKPCDKAKTTPHYHYTKNIVYREILEMVNRGSTNTEE